MNTQGSAPPPVFPVTCFFVSLYVHVYHIPSQVIVLTFEPTYKSDHSRTMNAGTITIRTKSDDANQCT